MTGLGAVPSPGRGETLGLRQELDAAWGPGTLGRSHVGRPVMEMVMEMPVASRSANRDAEHLVSRAQPRDRCSLRKAGSRQGR